MEKEFDVFISYKSEEREDAFYFKSSLEADGLTVWMDRYQISTSKYYVDVINENLTKCRCLVMLLSNKSSQSVEVKREIEIAKNNDVPVFAVCIDGVVVDDRIRELFKYTENHSDKDFDKKDHQIETRYCDPKFGKYFALKELSKTIYESVKHKPPKLDKDRQKERIENFQKEVKAEQEYLNKHWFVLDKNEKSKEPPSYAIEAISRCGFKTPEPEIFYIELKKDIDPYFILVDSFIEEVVNNVYDDEDKSLEFLKTFCNNKLTDVLWISYEDFCSRIIEANTKKEGEEKETLGIDFNDKYFRNRLYCDYINIIKSEAFTHPVVRLLKALKEKDSARYSNIYNTIIMTEEFGANQTEWQVPDTINAFIDTLYIGTNIRAFQGDLMTDNFFKLIEPSDIRKPKWFDFVRLFRADEVIETNSAKKTREFIYKHAICTIKERKYVDINHMYFYFLDKCIAEDNIRSVVVFAQEAKTSVKQMRKMGFKDFTKFYEGFKMLVKMVELSLKYNGYSEWQIEEIRRELGENQ